MPGDKKKLHKIALQYRLTDIKDFNSFDKKMNDPEFRQDFFNTVSSKELYTAGDFEKFSNDYGYKSSNVDTKPKSSVKPSSVQAKKPNYDFGDVGALKAGEYEVGTKGTDTISNTGAKAAKQENVNLIEYNKIRQEQSKEEGYYAMKAQKEQTGSFTFNPIPVLEGKDKILANIKSPMEIYQGWMSDRGDQASKKRFELELGAVGKQKENLVNAIEYLSDEIEKKIGTNTFEYLGDMQVKIKDAYAEVDKFAQEVEKAGRVNTYNGKKIFTKTEDLKKYKELVSQAEALQNEVKPFFNDPLIQEFTELSGAYRYNNALFQSVLADPKNQDAQDFNRVIEERQKEVDEAYKNGSTIGNIARSGFSILSNTAAKTVAAIPQMASILSDINKPDAMTTSNFLGELANGIVSDMQDMAGQSSTHDQREFSTLTAKDVMGEYQVDFDTQGRVTRVLDKKGFKAGDSETQTVTEYVNNHPEIKIESKNNWDVLPYLTGQMSADLLTQVVGTKGLSKVAMNLGAANKLAGKIGTISMIAAQTIPVSYEQGIAAGLSRRQAGLYAYAMGAGIGAIGTIGNLEAKLAGVDNPVSKTNPFSRTGVRATTGTMSGWDLAKIHVSNIAEDLGKEAFEESIAEPLYQFGLETAINGFTGKKNFSPEEQFTWENIKSNTIVTIASTILPGTLGSRTNEVTNHSLNTAFENFDLYKDKVRQMAQLGQLNLRGKEPDKFVDEHIAEIEQAKNIADLFDTTENRSDIAGLAWEKSKLLNQKSKLYDLKDKERIQRKIDFIDLQLSKYENTGKKTDQEGNTGDSASAESETAATRQAYEGGVEPTPPTEGTEIPFDPEPTETPDTVPSEPIERPDEFEKKAKDASMDEELALELEGKNEEERKVVLQEYYNTKPSETSAKTQAIKDKLRAGYSPEQADASMALLEAKAFKWAADNDKTVDEFYDQFDKVEYKKGNRVIVRDKEGIVGIGEVQEVSKDKKFVRTDLSDKFVPIEETELVDPSVKEEIPREFSPSNKGEFTSSKGLVVKEIDGEIVTLKDGVETKKGRKQALREYAQRFDFTEGDEAELNENIREDKINSHIAENSNNPSELAKVFLEEEPVGEMLSEKERVIAENGIFTTKESFAEFDDKNNLDPKMQGYFKSKKGLKNFPLDVIAQEMSPEPGESGVEITPQDLVDFMNKFPDSREALMQGESEAKTIARERFKELTGLDLDDEIAMEAVNQRVEKLSQIEKDLLDAEYESRAELEAAYERAYAETDGFTKETDPVGVAPEVSKEARKINNALNAPDFETLVEELMPVFESTLTEDEKVTFRSDSEQGIDSPLTDQFKSFVKSAADGKVSPEVQAEMDAVMAIPGEKFAEKFEELNKAPTVPEEKIEEVKDISVYKKVKEIFKNIFGLKDKQAKAAAKLADKILGTIAERAGVSKEDASILINWQKATEDDIKRLTDAGREVYFQLKGEVDDSKIGDAEKIKVYRGKGRNVGLGENEGITWVAEDRKVAENYSSDGNVEEIEVVKPKNPFPNPTNTIYVKGSDVGGKLRLVRDKLFKEGKLTKEKALEVSKAIDEFVSAAGEESELYSTKTNKKGVSLKYVKALQLMGFDGIVQQESFDSASPFTQTETGNETTTYGIFNESDQPSVEITPELKSQVNQGLPLFQQDGEVHGAVEFLNDMAAIIYAVTNPNVSTPLHELTHVYEKYLTDAEKTEVENWSGEKSGTREFSEAFARGFERYLYDGVSPNTKMQDIFDKFRKWMHEIYQTVVGQKLNRQMQNIYANMLGVPEHIVGIPNPVGGTKEYTKEMFEAMGRDPLVKKMSRAWDKVWEEAINNVKSGLVDPAQVVLDIITGGAMPAADLTQAYILIDRARISAQMELNKLAFEEAQNEPDEDKSNFMYVQAMERMAQLEEDIQKNGMAGDRLGTGAGQLLNFMKVFADRDYSLVSVLWQARKMKPRKVDGTVTYDQLTAEETKRFTELTTQLEAAQNRVNELEAKVQQYDDAEAEIMGQEVIDDLKPERKRTIAKRAKKLANQIRAGKIHKPGSLYSVTPVTAAWDAALEVTALAIDNGGKLIEAVQKGIDIIREWKMSQADKDETVLKFKEYMKQFSPIGNVTVLDDSARAGMNKMVREKVEDGLETINEVVDAIYEEIKDQIPGLTWRELRDFISGYGVFRKKTPDEVRDKIREIKRDGRDDAALEDVNDYRLPKRTGVQRDKPTAEQRRKRAEILKGIKEKGLEPPMTEEEMEAQWRTSEDAYIARLENAIDDIQSEIDNKKLREKPKGRVFDSDEVKALQAKKQRKIEERDALLGTRRSNLTTDQKIEMAKKATERIIDKIQQGITNLENGLTEEGDIYPERRKNEKLHSAELDALRAEKDALVEQRDMLIPQEVRDTALINRVIKSRQRTLAALEDIQARKDYAKKEKTPAPETKEIIDLNRKIFNLKLEIDTEKEKVRLRNLSAWEKVANILGNMWNVSKALRATIDLSAPLRQGKFFIGKPGIWGRAFIDMFKYAKSKKYFENQMADLVNSEEYYQMRKHKLYLSTPNARLDAQEEVFMADWLYYVKKYTWLYGKAIEASERAYTGFLNELRVGVYRAYSETIKKEIENGADLDYDAEMESYASIINNGTGRASLGFVEGAAPLLNGVFWAPRNAISRWNLSPFTPVGWYFYAQRSPRARKELLKDQFKFLGVVLSTLALVKMAWGCKDECDECDDCVKIELDSTSSDFLKIQLGKLRFDLLAGFQQVARTTSQMWYGQKKSAKTGEVQFLPSNEYKSDTRLTVGMEFVRSKLSPSSSLVVSALDGMKTSMGEPLTIGTAAQSLAEPLSIEQVYEIAREEGLGTSAISLVSLFGEGVQYFKEETPEEKAAKKKATKLENKEIKLKERQLND